MTKRTRLMFAWGTLAFAVVAFIVACGPNVKASTMQGLGGRAVVFRDNHLEGPNMGWMGFQAYKNGIDDSDGYHPIVPLKSVKSTDGVMGRIIAGAAYVIGQEVRDANTTRVSGVSQAASASKNKQGGQKQGQQQGQGQGQKQDQEQDQEQDQYQDQDQDQGQEQDQDQQQEQNDENEDDDSCYECD